MDRVPIRPDGGSDERRGPSRRRIDPPLRVYRQPGGQRLGDVVNLSVQGLTLVGDEPIDPEQSLVLYVELPPSFAAAHDRRLLLKGISVWCHPTDDGRYSTGFHLVRLPNDAARLIERLGAPPA